jgi:hypothetical protein
MSVEMNAENRNIQMNVPTRRCCSFCRNTGHNITTCNDDRLLEFERLCITSETNLGSAAFKEWLLGYSLQHQNVTRAYAVRYCGCSVRNYLMTCVDHIVRRISGLNDFQQPREPPSQSNYDSELWNRLRRGVLSASQTPLLHQMFVGANNIEELMSAMLFVEMITRVRDDLTRSRKFNIQTNVVECSQSNTCECNICYESKLKPEFVKLNCGHEFCKDCLKQFLQNVRTEQPLCAFCRSEIINMELTSEDIRNEFNELITPL